MRALLLALVLVSPAMAQTIPSVGAPPAGSGGGGPVTDSVSQPRVATGKTPPGTPNNPAARDATGTAVIGKTTASGAGAPGQTDGKESGVRK